MTQHVLHCPLSARPGDVLGHRKDGRPIHPIAGGSAPAGEAPPAAPPAPAPGAPSPAPSAPPAPAPPAAPPAQLTAQEVKDLPDWAQRIITDARKDAGDSRAAAKTAVDTAVADITTKMQVALGLKADPAADPVELAKKLADAQSASKATAIQLAVFKSAGKHQADADALLDSNSFMSTVNALDPTAGDFATKVDAAIKDAVAANTKLKAGLAPGTSGGQFPGGPGGGGKRSASLGAAINGAYGPKS